MMSVLSNIKSQTSDELMRLFAQNGDRNGAAPEDRDEWLDEAAVQLAAVNPRGVSFLLSSVDNADERKLRAILVGLASTSETLTGPMGDAIVARVTSLLHDPRPMILAEAVDTLSQLGCKTARPTIVSLLTHDSPFVVGAALRYLASHFPDEAIPCLEQALDSMEPIVRQNAIDELEEMEHLPALPLIRRLLDDPDTYVREAAQTAVRNLEELNAN